MSLQKIEQGISEISDEWLARHSHDRAGFRGGESEEGSQDETAGAPVSSRKTLTQ